MRCLNLKILKSVDAFASGLVVGQQEMREGDILSLSAHFMVKQGRNKPSNLANRTGDLAIEPPQ